MTGLKGGGGKKGYGNTDTTPATFFLFQSVLLTMKENVGALCEKKSVLCTFFLKVW